jgi:hypothetical protein
MRPLPRSPAYTREEARVRSPVPSTATGEYWRGPAPRFEVNGTVVYFACATLPPVPSQSLPKMTSDEINSCQHAAGPEVLRCREDVAGADLASKQVAVRLTLLEKRVKAREESRAGATHPSRAPQAALARSS